MLMQEVSNLISQHVGKMCCRSCPQELKQLRRILPESHNSPQAALYFLKNMEMINIVPNLWIALRVLSTVPTLIATADRDFTELEVIKAFTSDYVR